MRGYAGEGRDIERQIKRRKIKMKKKLYQFFEGKGSGERGRDMKMKKKGEK